jgi:signal peptidase II
LETASRHNVNVALRTLLWLLLLIVVVLAADQWIKIWVKTNMAWREQINLLGDWFVLHYTENNGMAFGIELGGRMGKLALTAFRISAVIFGFWYLWQQIQRKAHKGFLLCVALIIAGALGNIIDSVFYGVWFRERNFYPGGWFEGHVVDMFYAPIWEGVFPTWFPIWAGEPFTFFGAIWNLADAAISVGVISILVFQRWFFPHDEAKPVTQKNESSGSDAETNKADGEALTETETGHPNDPSAP